MKNKNWKLKNTADESRAEEIAESLGITRLAARLLCSRGMDTPEKAKAFISLSDTLFHDPFLMPDMDKAVDRIRKAVNDGEKIVIYGDYDVDGVTSVSTLWLYLNGQGANVSYYIPDRSGEGYGVNPSAIDQFARDGISLMITVDTGVTATEETEYARSLGIDTVITDHHECHLALPDAVAVVNPRRIDSLYPFKELAGVGVVFKLVSALIIKENEDKGISEGYLTKAIDGYIDLVAMGTIADVMPLTDENRLFVSMGLKKINTQPRKGIEALVNAATTSEKDRQTVRKKTSVTSLTISYTVAPRINAAGRIDNASKAVELFLTSDEQRADTIAAELCLINKTRQAEENRIMEEATARIEKEINFERDRVIVLDDDGWHHGVIGIVASRITEKYSLPCILISFEGNTGKGSGRSIKGINLVDVLANSAEHLVKFGGHELAAGLTVEREKLADFKRSVNEYVKANMDKAIEQAYTDVDMMLLGDEITTENAESLSVLEPFGVANPVPLFEICKMRISDIMPVAGKHTRITFKNRDSIINAVIFGRDRQSLEFYQGDSVDVLATLSVNEFRDKKNAQLIIRDIRLSEGELCVSDAERARYKEVLGGGAHRREEDLLPRRDEVSLVYLYLRRKVSGIGSREEPIGIRVMLSHIRSQSESMSYTKLRLILDILTETGVIDTRYYGESGESICVSINFVKNKVDIESAPTYSRIKNSVIR